MLKIGRFTIVAVLLQGLFIVLFAVFVKYPRFIPRVHFRDRDDMDDKAPDSYNADYSDEKTKEEVITYYPCKYGTSLLSMLSIELCYSVKYETSMLVV